MLSISRILTIAVVVALAAGTAGAGINTDKDLGPLNLWIDSAGVGTMINDSGAAFTFDGYSIASAGGNIAVGNWITMSDHAPDRQFVARTGQPPIVFPTDLRAAMWSVLSDTPHLIAEAHLEITATLQPGDGIDLGAAFPFSTHGDLTFTYVNSNTGESYEGGSWRPYVPPTCDPDMTADLPATQVWDFNENSRLIIDADLDGSPGECWDCQWTWEGFPDIQPVVTDSLTGRWDWSGLQAAGVTPGTYTIAFDITTECTTAGDTMTLTIVPEPASLSLMALGATALLRRRR